MEVSETDVKIVPDQITEKIKAHLNAGEIEEILTLLSQKELIENHYWDIIPSIIACLISAQKSQKLRLFEGCKKALSEISNLVCCEELILHYIEELEEGNDDTKFSQVLLLLEDVLPRVVLNNANFLTWSFNSIYSYVKKVIENDRSELERIQKLFLDVLRFYKSFEIFSDKPDVSRATLSGLHELLALCVRFNHTFNELNKFIIEDIVRIVLNVQCDPFRITEICKFENNSDLALGFAYLLYNIFHSKIMLSCTPQVYSNLFVLEYCQEYCVVFLESQITSCVNKAVSFLHSLYETCKQEKLSFWYLEKDHQKKFIKAVEKIIVYDENEKTRKKALALYKNYLFSFDAKGSYLLFYNIVSILEHSGLLGFTITQYKELTEQNKLSILCEDTKYFEGVKLYTILNRFSELPEKGSIMDQNDQVVAVLNLMRYVIIRYGDKDVLLTDIATTWKTSFLEILKDKIHESKKFYNLQINEARKETVCQKDHTNTISVNKEIVEITPSDKINDAQLCLNALDMMDNLRNRLIYLIRTVVFKENVEEK